MFFELVRTYEVALQVNFSKHKGLAIPEPPPNFAQVGIDWYECHASYVEHHATKQHKPYPLRHKYYDFFPGTQKNLSPFVDHALNKLCEVGAFAGLTKLHIFTDSAAKHFKNRKTLRIILELSNRLNIPTTYHFWASYHRQRPFRWPFCYGEKPLCACGWRGSPAHGGS